MGGKVLVLLRYVSALAVYVDGHEGEVAFHATSGCIVNFEPKTVTAGRAGHTSEGGGLTGWQSRVSVQRNLKGDSPRGGAERGRKFPVSLTGKQQTTSDMYVNHEGVLLYQPFFFGPRPNTAIHVGHGGRSLHYTCCRDRSVSLHMYQIPPHFTSQ